MKSQAFIVVVFVFAESAHSRDEIRHHILLSNVQELIDPEHKWENLNSIGMENLTAPFGLFVAQCLQHALVRATRTLAAARLQSEVRSQNFE